MGKEGIQTLQEELYSVTVKDLTPEELRASSLPDGSIVSIQVEFTSEAGKSYNATHVRKHPQRPYILLCGLNKDRTDFEYVKGIVAEKANGIPDRAITDRSDDICGEIKLRYDPTQAIVADLVEKYREHFGDVKIPVAYFEGVPKSAYENSGLPSEKLTFSQYLCICRN